ncbi:MAG: BREX system P-loop protein BrxC, partial [Verrucomicrobiota bacterium]
MKNRDIFLRDPATAKLMNNGQARINEGMTPQEWATLREELSNFVCEGQYADGMLRILEAFLGRVGGTDQSGAWVSGFYGSGKSHLLKMIGHLWMNTVFPDGATARSLVPRLPAEIEAALKELDTAGRRAGGMHAAFGALPSGSA